MLKPDYHLISEVEKYAGQHVHEVKNLIHQYQCWITVYNRRPTRKEQAKEEKDRLERAMRIYVNHHSRGICISVAECKEITREVEQ